MSYYKNLTIAVEALGLDIDMDEVHLGTVQFYQEEYERKTGKEIGVVDAIKEIYGKKGKK